jgi:hypothetical protein
MMNPGVDLLMAVNWDGAVMQYYEEFYASAEEEELPELTSVFPDDPEPTQGELNVAAEVAESDSPDDPPATVEEAEEAEEVEEVEPVTLEVSITNPIDVNEVQVEVVETRRVRGLGVMGTAAVSLGGLMLVVVLGTLAVSRKKK